MKLTYLLDTNICIYIAKQKPVSVLKKFEQLAVGTVGMSTITYGELIYGAQKSHYSERAMTALEELTSLIPPLPLPTDTAKFYGIARQQLQQQGNIIGNNDLWIAAHALAMDLIVVTNNTREFSRVDKLTFENWVQE